MRQDVALDHVGFDLQLVAFDDDLPDAAEESGLGLPPGQPLELGVAADEEAVVRVRRGDAGNADAGLCEDVVDRQRHDVLGFDG